VLSLFPLGLALFFGFQGAYRPALALVAALAAFAIGLSLKQALAGRAAEGELERRLEDALARATRAAKTDEARYGIIRDVNHEFRNPLNGIIGLSDFLLIDEKDAERAEMLREIAGSGWRLHSLVNKAVRDADLAGPERDEPDEDIDCPALLAELRASFSAKASSRGLMIETRCPIVGRLRGRRASLTDILSELLDNAVRHSSDGLIRLSARTLAVSDATRELVEFSVVDAGPGLSARAAEELFMPVARAGPNGGSGRGGDLGLGLFVAKRLTESLRGELRIQSSPGAGTTAFLVAPFERPEGERGGIE
jgi:signal transduction histidine kinase